MPGPGRRFQKGESGNRSGRPKLDVTITELARAHGPRAIEVLAELMNDPKATASARAMAADRILDRAYGRPPQLTTPDAIQFRRVADLTDEELIAIATGLTDGVLIEGEASELPATPASHRGLAPPR
jgi:hypothetical protein